MVHCQKLLKHQERWNAKSNNQALSKLGNAMQSSNELRERVWVFYFFGPSGQSSESVASIVEDTISDKYHGLRTQFRAYILRFLFFLSYIHTHIQLHTHT